jgi:Tfp pilus assembly protein PilF
LARRLSQHYQTKKNTMKRISIFLTFMLATAAAFAQNANRVSAYNYMKDGEFLKAKEPIDEAVQHKSQKD